jgi:hypothetical protein
MELTKDGLAALRVSALWAGDDDRVLDIRIRGGHGHPLHLFAFIDTFFRDTFEAADQRAGMYYPDSCSDGVVVLRLWHTGIPGRIPPDP